MTRESISIRPGRRDDGPELAAMVHAALHEHGLVPEPAGVDADLMDVEERYLARGGCFEVLVNEAGDVVGCYGLVPGGDSVVELRKMFFKPELRGRGIGSALLKRAIGKAKDMGFSSMRLETASCLVAAKKLYEHFGFVALAGRPNVPRCDLAYQLDLGRLNKAARATPRYDFNDLPTQLEESE
ncbi:MAG: GNAT family N-acetyltransferase [Gammaproteobacteria bacterium]|nr:GNAT family N-acetyltransferase [Gammaproteobacteria bacterium]